MSTISTVVSIASIENLLIEMQKYTIQGVFAVEEYGSILASRCNRLESYRNIFQDRVSNAQKALDSCELARSFDPDDSKRSCASEESKLAKASADYAKYDRCMTQLYAALTEYRKSESRFFSEIDILKSNAVPSLSSKLNLLKAYRDGQPSNSRDSDRNCYIPVKDATSIFHEYSLSQESGVYIGNGTFKGINNELKEVEGVVNMENVNKYMRKASNFIYDFIDNPNDLGIALPALFLMVTSSLYFSGYDVNVIRNKLPSERTSDETQAIIDYNEFVDQVCDKIISTAESKKAKLKETKVFEMAALSDAVYGDSRSGVLEKTNYILVNGENQGQNKELQSLINAIDICNTIGRDANIGFSVSLFCNKITGEYTLAFRGSDDFFDFLNTNIPQSIGADAPQYIIANTLSQAIQSVSNDVNINLTGHSLGGGLASLVGAITGRETVTFNAAGVNSRTLESFGVNPDSDFTNNITAYSLRGEILTFIQDNDKHISQTMRMIHPATVYLDLPSALGERHIIDPSFHIKSNLEMTLKTSGGAIIGGTIAGPTGAVAGAIVTALLSSDNNDIIVNGCSSGVSEVVEQIAKAKGVPAGAVPTANIVGALVMDAVEKHSQMYLVEEFGIRQKMNEQYQYYERAINSALRQRASENLYRQEAMLIQPYN